MGNRKGRFRIKNEAHRIGDNVGTSRVVCSFSLEMRLGPVLLDYKMKQKGGGAHKSV